MLLGKKLRSDYLLYIIGVMLLVITCYALFNSASLTDPMGGMLIYSAIVFVLALFGITAFIFGYSLRPKKQKLVSPTSSPTVESLIELTRLKGIADRRAEQLKELGIITVADLSAASAE
jgi:hypothetical protein